MSAVPPFDGFEERDDQALWPSIALALAVHLVLLGILFFGVRWQSHEPSAMVVELWPAPPSPAPVPAPKVEPPKPEPQPKVVQPPPPPPPPPKPEPRIEKPDIAIKAPPKPKPKPPPPKPEVKPKPKPKPEPKPEPKPKPKPKPKPEPKPKPREDVFRKQMEEQLARDRKQMQEQLAREEQQISAQRQEAELRDLLARDAAAARSKALAAWADQIRAAIRRNIILPQNIQGNPEAVFEIALLPTGEVLHVTLKKSSNNHLLDEAIDRAIRKSSPLPKPKDPSVFDRNLQLTYRPHGEP